MPNRKEPSLEVKAKLSGTEGWKEWCKEKSNNNNASHGTIGALYFVGFIGALVYWIQTAESFSTIITGILKAMVWPAYIVYKLLENFYGVVL